MDSIIIQIFFALIRSLIRGVLLSDDERALLTDEALAKVLALAKKHDLAALVCYALAYNGVTGGEQLQNAMQMAQIKAVYRYEQIQYTLNEARAILENAEIPFVPLKGAVIRQFYPEPWMRTSCDIDVLVHENDLDRAIAALTAQKWTVHGERNYHDISLYSPNGVHLELHFNIKENIETIDKVLERVWEYTVPADGKQYELLLANEYLMLHLLAHISYHFMWGGCGIRALVDIWLLQQRLSYDKMQLDQLCHSAALAQFYACVEELLRAWFEGSPHTALTRKMEAFVISGGVYGSQKNAVSVQQARKGGRFKYLLARIFISYDALKLYYPILQKHKWLFPFMQVRRWFRLLFGGSMKRSIGEIQATQNISREQMNETSAFLSEVGL